MSAEGFDIFDGSPMIGRLFGHDDDRPDASPVVVLAGRLWRTRYGADPGVLGRVVRLDGAPATVIGILPDDFRLPGNTDVWLPLAQLSPKIRADRGARSLGAVARLRDGITIPGAAEEVDAISTRIAREHHETNAGVRFSAVPLNERYNGRITDPVWIAFMSVGGLLVLIACSNVANLLLARSVQRSREIAIRVSMGATRFRIFRQLLAEGTLLAALGGALGLVFSWLALRAFTSLIPEDGLPFWMSYTMDARVFGVLAGASLTTVILFGLAPALHIARTDVNDLLKQGGRTSSSGTRARRWTAALLSAQFGITMILLSSVGLTLRQFRAAERAAVVVDADHLLTLSVALPAERYGSPDQRRELYSRLRDRLAGADGVSAFAIASHLPFAGGSNSQLAIESRASVNPAVPGVLVGLDWSASTSRRWASGSVGDAPSMRATAGPDTRPRSSTSVWSGCSLPARIRSDGGSPLCPGRARPRHRSGSRSSGSRRPFLSARVRFPILSSICRRAARARCILADRASQGHRPGLAYRAAPRAGPLNRCRAAALSNQKSDAGQA